MKMKYYLFALLTLHSICNGGDLDQQLNRFYDLKDNYIFFLVVLKDNPKDILCINICKDYISKFLNLFADVEKSVNETIISFEKLRFSKETNISNIASVYEQERKLLFLYKAHFLVWLSESSKNNFCFEIRINHLITICDNRLRQIGTQKVKVL